MVSHNTLACRFGHGDTSGSGHNMFIEENVIYSYGHHFPIAEDFIYLIPMDTAQAQRNIKIMYCHN